MVNSRAKGASGEREWSKWLRDNGLAPNARRGQQRSGLDQMDVIDGIPGTHCEVKRVEKLNVQKAMEQAIRDMGEENHIPYVAHRRNNTEWLVTIRASDLVRFGHRIYHHCALVKRVEIDDAL